MCVCGCVGVCVYGNSCEAHRLKPTVKAALHYNTKFPTFRHATKHNFSNDPLYTLLLSSMTSILQKAKLEARFPRQHSPILFFQLRKEIELNPIQAVMSPALHPGEGCIAIQKAYDEHVQSG